MEGHDLICDWIWLVFLKWRETSLGMFSVKGCGFSAAVLYFNAPVLFSLHKGRRLVISCSWLN